MITDLIVWNYAENPSLKKNLAGTGIIMAKEYKKAKRVLIRTHV